MGVPIESVFGFTRVRRSRFLPVPLSFLVAALFFSVLSPLILTIVLVAALAFMGVPHGACDHRIAGSHTTFFKFYLSYLGRMLAFVALWFISPHAAFALFLVYSAFHFGECEIRGAGYRIRAAQLVWGAFAAFFGASQHYEQLKDLLFRLGLFPAELFTFAPAEVARAGLFLWLIACIASLREVHPFQHLLRTLLLGAVLAALPLEAGFVAFFCFWHSVDSMADQQQALGDTPMAYYRKGILHSAIAILMVAAAYGWFAFSGNQPGFWTVLLVVTGALTVAHGPVMTKFYLEPAVSETDLRSAI